jgi:thiol-disulfide isomerase/thioredoxin
LGGPLALLLQGRPKKRLTLRQGLNSLTSVKAAQKQLASAARKLIFTAVMIMRVRSWVLVWLWLGLTAGSVPGADAPILKVGDPAPKLQTAKWLQGEPLGEFERGKVYVVAFWSSTGRPCRLVMPWLSDLQRQYKDKGLVVIGLNVWDSAPEMAEAYLKELGEAIAFRIAVDATEENGRGKMAATWLAAAGQEAVPAAFLVDTQGRIAFIGHPQSLKDKLLKPVLDGSFEVKKAAEAYALALSNEPKLQALLKDYQRCLKNGEPQQALPVLEEMDKLAPEDGHAAIGALRFRMLMAQSDFKGAAKLAAQLSDAYPDEAILQNLLAWEMATNAGMAERDLDLIEKIARRANEAAKSKDPAILDTLARALFMKGNKAAAIELQEKAVKMAEGIMLNQLQAVLQSYREGRLPAGE